MFGTLKESLTSTLVIQSPNWNLFFEIMCDVSNFAAGVVPWRRDGRAAYVIYYTSRILESAQSLKYFHTKKEEKPRLVRSWILFSRLATSEKPMPLQANFSNELLFTVQKTTPWYTDIVNYLVIRMLPSDLSQSLKDKIKSDAKYYVWDDPYLWKYYVNHIIRRCVSKDEIPSLLSFCHSYACGGHFCCKITTWKVL